MDTILFIRHGETATNVAGVVHEAKDNARLTPRGVEQMHAVARRLAEYQLIQIYTSTEQRAQESGVIIAQDLHIPTVSLNQIEERNWGVLAGKPWAEIQAILDLLTLEERYQYTPEGGESWQQFETRLRSAFETLNTTTESIVAIVAHGGVIRASMPLLLGVPHEESFQYNFDNGSLTILQRAGEFFRPETVNDVSHL